MVLPFGVIAMAPGLTPTAIGWPAALVAVLIGVTVCESRLSTYTVFPSGVMAIPTGPRPTVIGLPAVAVAVRIGVTDAEAPLAT